MFKDRRALSDHVTNILAAEQRRLSQRDSYLPKVMVSNKQCQG